ncbi:MAG: hypothetical protein AAB609_01700 [Patescibacteria group bacterium]
MKQRDILFLVISTFVLILAWIGFSIYHNLVSSTITKPVEEKIIPINPTFDTRTIDILKERKNIEPIFQTKRNEATESTSIENITQPSETLPPSTNSGAAVQGENL